MSPKTLNDLYFQGMEKHTRGAFRRRVAGVYEDVSTSTFADAGREMALGLVSLGMAPGDRVAILAETRLEWAEADLAILSAGLASVPIYPTLTESVVEYVLKDSGARAIFVSGTEQAAKLGRFRQQRHSFPVFVFDDATSVTGGMGLEELRARGRALGEAEPDLYRRRAADVKPDDLATLIYTSGTTGPPKGVMLTHANIVSNVLAALQIFDLGERDTALSFLPLSHILERMAGLYCMWFVGATIAYAGSVDTVSDDLRDVHPTVMVSVPRLYEKIYARIFDAATKGGPIKKGIFFWARSVGLARARCLLAGKPVGGWLALRFRIADHLVFAKLRARTGGRLRFFVSGGAPLAPDIAEFFYAAGLIVLEGYGLTESSPVLAINTFKDIRLGTVGKPVPGVEIRIAEDGEILARGPNIMKGYYNMPEATAETLQDGWLHTGDIGHLDADGFLVITDRKKDLIVTAGGKNVAPQPIENALKTDKFIAEAVVIGDRRPYLVALIVPNFANIESYRVVKNLGKMSLAELVRHPRVLDLMRRRIERHQTDAAPYEKIRRFHILDNELTLEAGELTPTLKVKRKQVVQKYAARIEALYAEEAGSEPGRS